MPLYNPPSSAGIGGSTGATDNAILRANGIGGATAQSSALGVDDSGNILDANTNELIKTVATPSAVNEVTITNAATGDGIATGVPTISATGSDTNIMLGLAGKGILGVRVMAGPMQIQSGILEGPNRGQILRGTSGAVTIADDGDFTSIVLAKRASAPTIRPVAVAFASLPASPVTGERATVTDSTTTTYRATITGGGSSVVPAFYDGTNWIVQ